MDKNDIDLTLEEALVLRDEGESAELIAKPIGINLSDVDLSSVVIEDCWFAAVPPTGEEA